MDIKTQKALKMAIETMESFNDGWWPDNVVAAIKSCKEALESYPSVTNEQESNTDVSQEQHSQEQEQEQEQWLTQEKFADILIEIADCIDENKSESVRHTAHWIRKGER